MRALELIPHPRIDSYSMMESKPLKFDAVKMRIVSDERLQSDFDSCVTLNKDYIRQTLEGNDGCHS